MNKQESLKNIYRLSFGTDTEFENLLFDSCGSFAEVFEIDGVPVSFLFALPCKIHDGEKVCEFIYIFAAATHPDYRKKGYMAKLLEKVTEKYKKPLILRPANKELINYYKKFGFATFTALDTEKGSLYLTPVQGYKTLADLSDTTAEGSFTVMARNSPLNLNGLYFPYTMP